VSTAWLLLNGSGSAAPGPTSLLRLGGAGDYDGRVRAHAAGPKRRSGLPEKTKHHRLGLFIGVDAFDLV
jgi:hypothetical protein